MRLSSLGFLPGRVINLPVGVDNNLFYKTKELPDREYDFVIVNNDLQTAVDQVKIILFSERLRRYRQLTLNNTIKKLI